MYDSRLNEYFTIADNANIFNDLLVKHQPMFWLLNIHDY